MEPLPGTATPTRRLIELGVTAAELRRPEWRHPHRGIARPNGVDETHPLTRITDALPLLPGCGVIGGWSSLYLHGAEHVDGISPSGGLLPVRLHTCAKHRRVPRSGSSPPAGDCTAARSGGSTAGRSAPWPGPSTTRCASRAPPVMQSSGWTWS